MEAAMQRKFYSAKITASDVEGFTVKLKLKLCRMRKLVGERWVSIHVGDMMKSGLMQATGVWFPEDSEELHNKIVWVTLCDGAKSGMVFKTIAPWELKDFEIAVGV
jgi:hypothetical protein